MERCEPPRAPRDGARRSWRLADWQLREIVRVAGQVRAAGGRAVQLHGVVVLFRKPRRRRHGCWQQQRSAAVVGDASTASSAKPEQLSKRKQRSSMRLADFRRRMQEQREQAAAAKLLRLWSVVWLQRLVRRRMAERSRLAAEVALVREPGAGAGLQEAKADASESAWLQRAVQQQFVPGQWRLGSGRRARGTRYRLLRLWPGWVHCTLRPRPGPRRRRRW